jgi:hypothetical protein
MSTDSNAITDLEIEVTLQKMADAEVTSIMERPTGRLPDVELSASRVNEDGKTDEDMEYEAACAEFVQCDTVPTLQEPTIEKWGDYSPSSRSNTPTTTKRVVVTKRQRQEEESDLRKFYKTKPCKFYASRDGCKKGNRCTFSHVMDNPVCAFFNSTQGCTNGRGCAFVHSHTATASQLLHPCPNDECVNLCIGKQCMDCHNNHREEHGGDNGRDERRSFHYRSRGRDDRSQFRGRDDRSQFRGDDRSQYRGGDRSQNRGHCQTRY